MEINQELQKYAVSRETITKIFDFVNILQEWNQKMNLISKNSMEDVWNRHVFDSMQLINYIPKNAKNIIDIGSGSGFPGIILAILLQEKNSTVNLTMIESITKKTVYLNDVITKLCLNNASVKNCRIEKYKSQNTDIITARAVAELGKIFEYSQNIKNKNTIYILPKGKTFQTEIENAKLKWNFDYEIKNNEYSEDGVILTISNVKEKK